jgi:hypothetical protein
MLSINIFGTLYSFAAAPVICLISLAKCVKLKKVNNKYGLLIGSYSKEIDEINEMIEATYKAAPIFDDEENTDFADEVDAELTSYQEVAACGK